MKKILNDKMLLECVERSFYFVNRLKKASIKFTFYIVEKASIKIPKGG